MNSTSISRREVVVIDAVADRDFVVFSPEDIRRFLDIFDQNPYRILNRMQEKGLIRRVARGRYVLSEIYDHRDSYEITSHLEPASYIGFWSALHRLADATAALDRYGLPAELDRIDRRTTTVTARLRYDGPLYDGSERSRGSIELDVSTRDDVFRETEWRRLFVPYPETRAVTARCLTIEEAFAEKFRALSTRSRGRDLYDCWFLLQHGVESDPHLFEQKMGVLGESPTVRISITEREWERDLSILVEHPPSYADAIREVSMALEDAGLPVKVN